MSDSLSYPRLPFSGSFVLFADSHCLRATPFILFGANSIILLQDHRPEFHSRSFHVFASILSNGVFLQCKFLNQGISRDSEGMRPSKSALYSQKKTLGRGSFSVLSLRFSLNASLSAPALFKPDRFTRRHRIAAAARRQVLSRFRFVLFPMPQFFCVFPIFPSPYYRRYCREPRPHGCAPLLSGVKAGLPNL